MVHDLHGYGEAHYLEMKRCLEVIHLLTLQDQFDKNCILESSHRRKSL